MRRRKIGPCLLGVAAILLFSSCDRPSFAEREAKTLRALTTPPGGLLIEFEEPSLDGFTTTGSWSLQIPLRWEAYQAWVVGRLATFHRQAEPSDELQLFREVDGDGESLSFAGNPTPKGALVVHVTLTFRPL